ncbi:MAG: hypothetical protein P1V20_12930 [Verrucomicrobiales bacterium]|nr:hypothetical protein [Verrucomicrobiales bacterium]
MKGLPSPPLEGAELYTAYLTFYGVVLGGPISHFFTNYHLFHEWIYWIPFAGGSIAFLPLLITRFHSTGAIILSGVLWTGAGAVSLFYQICLAI